MVDTYFDFKKEFFIICRNNYKKTYNRMKAMGEPEIGAEGAKHQNCDWC
ncbi:MAG: hypothetical protein PWP21_1110 [Thermosediminibacterales bacterium]|nr:hypothetical protein [Thermosediminibacterales bacterium]